MERITLTKSDYQKRKEDRAKERARVRRIAGKIIRKDMSDEEVKEIKSARKSKAGTIKLRRGKRVKIDANTDWIKPGASQRFSQKEVEQALWETEGKVGRAALKLGCNPLTIYNYFERYPKLKKVRQAIIKKLKHDAEDVVVGNISIAKQATEKRLKLMEKMKDEDIALLGLDKDSVDTAIKVLARIDKINWASRQEITGKDGQPISDRKNYDGMSGDELKQEILAKLNDLKAIRDNIHGRNSSAVSNE